MFVLSDLGGAPANENCAQLGHTNDFHRLNRLEVDAYRAAIQARFGIPPEGSALVAMDILVKLRRAIGPLLRRAADEVLIGAPMAPHLSKGSTP